MITRYRNCANGRRSKTDATRSLNQSPVIFQLAKAPDYRFPDVELAGPEGLLAVGGDLSIERLLAAYRHGVFPWYSDGQPILWWSPDPRAILFPADLKVSKSLRKTIRKNIYSVTLDTSFEAVIDACAAPRRDMDDPGTWITNEMRQAYLALHEAGYAHSVEVWHQQELVGGLYGIALGRAFFGESMFSKETDASKTGLYFLAQQLLNRGYEFIDCQVESDHLQRLGAVTVSRQSFINKLKSALDADDHRGKWQLDPQLPRP